ncbi:MAG: hypothetical protein F6K10_13265 [Moorea sp. SIO2B7]|nr:hypothetical protein [Moorena sp. SIO2B7]
MTTPLVTSIAIEELTSGNLKTGKPAVATLLDRGALPQAGAALASVPTQQLNDPGISFLRGRLAWQQLQTGNKDYGPEDVRRFWERAVKKQPKSIAYLNALGFAYYAEGKFNRANQTWYNALSLIKEDKTIPQEALNTYAGLALGLKQLAQKQSSGKQRSILLNQAISLRQKVIIEDPLNFQPDALSNNWMWSEQAIQDWRSLVATTARAN